MSGANFDVAVIGGGVMGAAIAAAIRVTEPSRSVVVIERDPTFRRAASTLSAASIRQQFSTPENIRLSAFGWDFLSALDAERPVGLVERGYLILATPAGAAALEASHRMQASEGAPTGLLSAGALAAAKPWLSTEGIAAGTLGRGREGWFDGAGLLSALRDSARARGATLLSGEVVAVDTAGGAVAGVRLADDTRIRAPVVINAAGPQAGRIAALAGRRLGVEPRKRTVFVVDAPDAPADMPLVADPSGVWSRPEGRYFLVGYSPPPGQDGPADPDDFTPDHALFEDVAWPLLAHRIPAFERARVVSAWAGHYDFHTLDQNAVIGFDPGLAGFAYANGFSGHGIQHAPGVGRAVAELVADGGFRTIDLSRLGYARVLADNPFPELAVI